MIGAAEGAMSARDPVGVLPLGSRTPFLRLHGLHAATRLLGWSVPPLARAMTWSTVSAGAPQYWQR